MPGPTTTRTPTSIVGPLDVNRVVRVAREDVVGVVANGVNRLVLLVHVGGLPRDDALQEVRVDALVRTGDLVAQDEQPMCRPAVERCVQSLLIDFFEQAFAFVLARPDAAVGAPDDMPKQALTGALSYPM
jgi:hypothetical protein